MTIIRFALEVEGLRPFKKAVISASQSDLSRRTVAHVDVGRTSTEFSAFKRDSVSISFVERILDEEAEDENHLNSAQRCEE